ncbi:hypothetical protein [Polyangium sorediatum]|uniref:Uncharacterized protein n=1 Tax=Polyangium sorediatum TaxID=889274 RepID=A0ABT6P084_9BACT|nr:hypothetical protein [Polyangium sorediatum]MDI1434010.1 hypothetical protein [Polyangium sorediatum]
MSGDGPRTAAPLFWCEAGLVARVALDRVLVREPGGQIHVHGIAPSWIAAALDPTGDLVLADGERVLHADGRVALLDERAHLGAPDVLVFDRRAMRLAAAFDDVIAFAAWETLRGRRMRDDLWLPEEHLCHTVALADAAYAVAYRTRPYASEYGSAGWHQRGFEIRPFDEANKQLGRGECWPTDFDDRGTVSIAIDSTAAWYVSVRPDGEGDCVELATDTSRSFSGALCLGPGSVDVARDGTFAWITGEAVLVRWDEEEQAEFAVTNPQSVALSPDGAEVAWLDAADELHVRRVR